jgi:hypothetical protein
MNIVAARRTAGGVETRRMRDAFIEMDLDAKKMLKLSGVNFIEREDQIVIVGDAAMETANVFGKEARRPLSGGLVSASEVDALDILKVLIEHVLGKPADEDEVCFYSVPAAPIDALDRDVVYHEAVFSRIVGDCGYDAESMNEAMAIIFSETAADGFSGLGISFGSGMVNVALAVNSIEGLSFSLARGGDWIDAGAARAVGSTQARMCALKEGGIDLLDPKTREEEALVVYYKSLIDYALKNISNQFKKVKGQFALPKPIPIVVSGGTAMAGNFLPFFEQTFEKKRKRFPIEISEIRLAGDPLNAVAQGLLLRAMQEYDDD